MKKETAGRPHNIPYIFPRSGTLLLNYCSHSEKKVSNQDTDGAVFGLYLSTLAPILFYRTPHTYELKPKRLTKRLNGTEQVETSITSATLRKRKDVIYAVERLLH